MERSVGILRDLILEAHAAEHDGIRTEPAIDGVVVGIEDERVVPAATDRCLDDGALGNADIVRLEVRTAERSRIEIDDRGCGPSGQVERVVATSVPNRNDRMRVHREIEIARDRTGDVAVEAEDLAAVGERA